MKLSIVNIREKIIEFICFKNFKEVKKLKKEIRKNENKEILNKEVWDKAFNKYIMIGSNTCLDVCRNFYNIRLDKLKSINIRLSDDDPILICMVKNDLIRMKMILKYYRSIGVKFFAILDDSSTDGTKEYLLKQKDVELYETNFPYTTNIRQARINRIIDLYGFNRWYLIVDSDELFSYENMENVKIDSYIKNIKECVVKSLMLDMFPKDGLFFDIDSPDKIEKKYKFYDDNNYYYKENLKGKFIYGGSRSKLFSDGKQMINFTTSKISLVYAKPGMIMCNSHCIFPYTYNFGDATTILRHYKFLKNDIESYKERVKNNNFANNSIEYKSYINLYENQKNIIPFSNHSKMWENSRNIKSILQNIRK